MGLIQYSSFIFNFLMFIAYWCIYTYTEEKTGIFPHFSFLILDRGSSLSISISNPLIVLDRDWISLRVVELALMAALVGLSRILEWKLRLMELLTLSGTFPFVGLLTIFLSIQVLVCTCSSDYRNSPECNKPFKCGTIQDLSYPFRQRGSPVYCGEPGFELYCEGGNPMITISSRSYQVLVFNTTLKSLTLAPMGRLHDVLCPKHLMNISLNLSPFHSAWNTNNITLYYDCPLNANQYKGLSSHQFNCTMNGTDIIGYFVVTSAFPSLSVTAKDALRSCRNNVLLPAFASILQVLNHNPSSANLGVTLENGFGVQWSENDSLSGSSDGFSSKFKLTIGLGMAGAAILAVTVMVVTFRIKKESLSRGILLKFQPRKRKQWERIEAFILQYGSELAPKRYSYSAIKKITKSFKDELGQGGFGTVYKGKLPDGRLVAVKVLSESKGDGEEFVNEVASISRTSHVNIVPFLGFCYEGSIRALIYEFMPNGSLDKFICHQPSQDNRQLEVKTLYDIAIGIARGLEYLHQGCNTRILHFDIKPHNILLDGKFCPKISDFGLAKLCERKESIISTISARGTIGYIAPEVFCRSFGGVSHKSDVYSYGMMVLEMVGEKENIHGETSNSNFPLWIYEHLKEGADLNLQGMTVENEELIRKMIIVSLWCIQSNPSDRPSITKAIEMLQGSTESLSIPPTPFLFSPPRSPENSLATSFFTRSNEMDNSGYGTSGV